MRFVTSGGGVKILLRNVMVTPRRSIKRAKGRCDVANVAEDC